MRFCVDGQTERIGYDFFCDIAERVVERRKEKNWSQAQLAKAAGMSASRISDIETVRLRIKKSDVEQLAKCLDVSPDWLIEAHLDRCGKDCVYLVWNERFPDFKVYSQASSTRMAYLETHERISKQVRWFEPRDRAQVRLVGVPIEPAELKARFPQRTSGDDDGLEPDQAGKEATP